MSVLVVVTVLAALMVSLLVYWRRPAARYGKYVGISFAAGQGASFQDSRLDFTYDASGLVLDSPVIAADGARYAFKTHFTPDWLIRPLKGWGVDRGLAVRQHAKSDLAQVIFMFKQDFLTVWVSGADVLMILGEGMPAPLAIFVRADRPDAQERLRRMYANIQGPTREKADWLIQVPNVDAATFASYDSFQKRKLMEDAGHNLWTGSSEEIHRRLAILELGMGDRNGNVQIAALSRFTLGARVVSATPLVAGFLQQRDVDPVVIDKAIDAAACLLYEARQSVGEASELQSGFQTVDPAELYAKTDGMLTPEQHQSVEHLAQRTSERLWTAKDYTVLRQAVLDATARLQSSNGYLSPNTQRVLSEL